MATVIQELIYKIKADDAQFVSSLQKQQKSLDAVGKKFTDAGRKLSLAITAPIAGISAFAVKAASDFEETQAKFDTAFRGIEKTAEKTAKELAKSFLLSEKESKRLLSGTGDLLKGFGFTADAALVLSNDVQELASDLASYNNLQGGASRASEILTKALLGERDALVSLGTKVSDADVQTRLLEKGQKGLTGQALLAAKAQATFDLVLQQSGDAVGDIARTTDSFANQSRALKGDIEDLAVEIGKELLPAAKNLLSFVRDGIAGFRQFSPEIKRTILALAGIAAAVGPILLVIGKLIPLLGTLKGAVAFLGAGGAKSIVAFAASFGPLGIAIGAAVGAAGLLVKEYLELKAAQERLGDKSNFEAQLTKEEKAAQKIILRLNELKRERFAIEDVVRRSGQLLTRESERLNELRIAIFKTNDELAKSAFGRKRIADLTRKEKEELEKLSAVTAKKSEADNRRLVENLKLEASIAKTNGETEKFAVLQKRAIDLEEQLNVALARESTVVGDVRKARNEATIARQRLNKETDDLLDKTSKTSNVFSSLADSLADVSAKESVLGDDFDSDAAKIEAYTRALIDLRKQGLEPTSIEMVSVQTELDEISDKTAGLSKTQKDEISGVTAKLSEGLGRVSEAFQAVGDVISTSIDFANEKIKEQIELVDEQLEVQQEKLDAQFEAELERRGLAEQTAQESLAEEKTRLNELLEGTGLTYEELRSLDRERLDDTLERVLSESEAEKAKTQLQKTEGAERQALQDEFNEKKEEADEKAEKKLSNLKYKAELNAWKKARNDAIINTIAASLAAFTSAMSLPPPANFIVGAIAATTATTFGSIQAALISKRKPKRPSFAVGALDVPSDTQAMVHAGETIIPKTFAQSVREGEAIVASPEAIANRAGATASQPIVVNLILDSLKVGQVLFERSKNGEFLVSQDAVVVT